MFEYQLAATGVAEGSVSPLALVAGLEGLDDETVLGLELSDALAVVELVAAASAALSAVSSLAVEAVARRTREELSRAREDRRRRGERVMPLSAADVADVAEATLAPVLHLTPRSMGHHLEEVGVLVNDLPGTFALVRAGRLDLHRATAVAAQGCLVAAGAPGPVRSRGHHPDRAGADAVGGSDPGWGPPARGRGCGPGRSRRRGRPRERGAGQAARAGPARSRPGGVVVVGGAPVGHLAAGVGRGRRGCQMVCVSGGSDLEGVHYDRDR